MNDPNSIFFVDSCELTVDDTQQSASTATTSGKDAENG